MFFKINLTLLREIKHSFFWNGFILINCFTCKKCYLIICLFAYLKHIFSDFIVKIMSWRMIPLCKRVQIDTVWIYMCIFTEIPIVSNV